jgi:hypothetical protein
MSCSRVVFLCGLFALSAVASGCQRKPTWNLAPVEGTVTKDGHPLANIEVIFRPDLETGTQGPRASGTTDEAGHYRLRTDNGDEGAVTGKHRVLLQDLKARKERMGRATSKLQPKDIAPLPSANAKRPEEQRVPPRYGHFNETPLRVEVHPGPQVIDLDVK